MANPSPVLKGVIHGRTIELEERARLARWSGGQRRDPPR